MIELHRHGSTPFRMRISRFELDGVEYLVVSYESSSSPARLRTEVTRIEAALIRGIMDGLTNVELALARNRAPSTISKQLSALYKKMNVSSRGELVALLR